jgi:hypothetical protein
MKKGRDSGVDEQIVGMIRDNFAQLHDKCDSIQASIQDHVKKDEIYWKDLDEMKGQMSLLKWLFGSLSLSGFGAWLFSNFGKH